MCSQFVALILEIFFQIGGTLELNGMYGNANAWTVLKKTANRGANTILVGGDVTKWPVGSQIAIASTDYSYRQAEQRKITFTKKGTEEYLKQIPSKSLTGCISNLQLAQIPSSDWSTVSSISTGEIPFTLV